MKSLRITPQRRAILEVIRSSCDHPTAGDIYQRVVETLPGIAYGTVYNTINYLTEKKQVIELSIGDRASRYDGNVEPHHHGLCEQCGRLHDLSFELPSSVIKSMEAQSEFHVQDYHVLFRGTCCSCREANPSV